MQSYPKLFAYLCVGVQKKLDTLLPDERRSLMLEYGDSDATLYYLLNRVASVSDFLAEFLERHQQHLAPLGDVYISVVIPFSGAFAVARKGEGTEAILQQVLQNSSLPKPCFHAIYPDCVSASENLTPTTAIIALGAAHRVGMTDDPRVMHRYAILVENIRYHADFIDEFCATNAPHLQSFLNPRFALSMAFGFGFVVASGDASPQVILKGILLHSPGFRRADLDAIYNR